MAWFYAQKSITKQSDQGLTASLLQASYAPFYSNFLIHMLGFSPYPYLLHSQAHVILLIRMY